MRAVSAISRAPGERRRQAPAAPVNTPGRAQRRAARPAQRSPPLACPAPRRAGWRRSPPGWRARVRCRARPVTGSASARALRRRGDTRLRQQRQLHRQPSAQEARRRAGRSAIKPDRHGRRSQEVRRQRDAQHHPEVARKSGRPAPTPGALLYAGHLRAPPRASPSSEIVPCRITAAQRPAAPFLTSRL